MNNDFEEGIKAYFNLEKFDKNKSQEWQDGWCDAWAHDYKEFTDRMTEEE